MEKHSIIFLYLFVVIKLIIAYNSWNCRTLTTLCMIGFSSIISWIISSLIYNRINKKRINTNNKAVLITGCGSGFGHSLALECDKLGFNVFAGVKNPDTEGAQRLREICSERTTVIKMDVRSPEEVADVVRRITDSGLELWSVVNNAGVSHLAPIEWGHDVKPLTDVFDVNVLGTVRVTNQCLPLLRRSKGRVINISSYTSRMTTTGFIPYSMSKHAIRSFGDGLRKEVDRFGIKVIAIEPVIYRTPLADKNNLINKLDDMWRQTAEDVQSIYGQKFRNTYEKKVHNLLKFSRKDISEVVNAMISAIVLKYPNNTYKCGGIVDFLLTFPMSYLPERAQNYIITSIL